MDLKETELQDVECRLPLMAGAIEELSRTCQSTFTLKRFIFLDITLSPPSSWSKDKPSNEPA
jgi:hypothetical protein